MTTNTISSDRQICWQALGKLIKQPISKEKTKEAYHDWLNTHAQTLSQLKELPFYNKKLTSVPSEIQFLKGLEIVDLERNQLRELHRNVGQLDNLQKLILHSNQLKKLPEKLENLKQLKVLDLTLNAFTEFPKVICQLTGLEKLKLHNCQIQKIPKEIANLTNLKVLDIAHNQLKELPEEMGMLSLRKLNIEGNPITRMPRSLWKNQNIRKQLNKVWLGNVCSTASKVAMWGFVAYIGYHSLVSDRLQYEMQELIHRNIPNISVY